MAKSNFDKCMGGGKAELLDSLIKKSKKKVKYVFEAGDKVEDKEVVSIWDEIGKANPTVFNNLINNIKKRGDK
jgi:hypothetical protein